MLAIHAGMTGSSPGFGRFCHCLAAIAQNRTPIATLSQLTPVSSASLPPPSTTTTATLTASSPAIQPSANAGPAVRAWSAPRTTTIATIGIGLSATASADGRRSPIASPSTAPFCSLAQSLRRGRARAPELLGDRDGLPLAELRPARELPLEALGPERVADLGSQ